MRTAVTLTIANTQPFADGHGFADAGAYERVTGSVHFALDPADPANANVVDLALAPTNAQGLVEFTADLDILKPVDLARGNGRLLYDVNNRGNKTALRAFNDGPPEPNPLTLKSAGNGYLLRQGYTLIWSGWQGDLLAGGGMLACDLPEAIEDGKRVRGLVRQEFVADANGVLAMPLSGAANVRNYEAVDLDPANASMTVREHETDERQPLASTDWAFADAGTCAVVGGFKPGWIYELIYETEGSRVMGLGLVGIRDLMAFLRHHDASPFAGHAKQTYIYGQSLSARVVRQFIYDGYNVDPDGRQVFSAAYTHVSGGGRLFANTRFAQVGRYPRQHEEHQWPSERYPFAYSAVPDAFSPDLDSVLKRPETDPLIMHTHTNTEYWNRHASLGHTDPRTGDDLELPDNVRMYFLASAQHMGSAMVSDDVGQQAQNRMSNGPLMRAALAAMDAWAVDGTAPAPSRIPSRADETLVSPEQAIRALPRVSGFDTPSAPSRLPLYDYGSDFERGFVTEHPPKPVGDKEYTVQLPLVDADGNDLGGLRSPEILVPVGTHTGWNLRREGFAQGDFTSLMGSFVPFARTKAERDARGDPRASIEERYASHDAYVNAIMQAAQTLVEERLLLQEDVPRYAAAAQARNPLDSSVKLAPLELPN
jgi:hypothetical protein